MTPDSPDLQARREQLQQLEPGARRKLMTHSTLQVAVPPIALITVYFFIPIHTPSPWRALTDLVVGLAGLALLLIVQFKRTSTDDYPLVRATQALALAIPALVVVFALCYLIYSDARPDAFSEPLNHVGALYYSTSIISTVGFGDIVATSDVTRAAVMLQIALDLIMITGIARAFVEAARTARNRQPGAA